MVVVTAGWAGIMRSIQAELSPLLYTENFTLYRLKVGCNSLLENCVIDGEQVIDNLYTLPLTTAAPDGKQIAVHLFDQWAIYDSVCLFEQTNCKPRLLDPSINDARIAWGPDGSLLAYVDNSGTILHLLTRGCWEPETGRCLRKQVQLTEQGRLSQIHWSVDGQWMIFVDGRAANFGLFNMECLDNESGCAAYQRRIAGNYPSITFPTLSADGSQVLYHADTSLIGIGEQLFIMDTATGVSRQITFRSGASLHPARTADGRYIAYVGFANFHSGDLELFVMDLQRGLTLPLLHHENQDIDYPTWGVSPP